MLTFGRISIDEKFSLPDFEPVCMFIYICVYKQGLLIYSFWPKNLLIYSRFVLEEKKLLIYRCFAYIQFQKRDIHTDWSVPMSYRGSENLTKNHRVSRWSSPNSEWDYL